MFATLLFLALLKLLSNTEQGAIRFLLAQFKD
jgi:hypothetical protein